MKHILFCLFCMGCITHVLAQKMIKLDSGKNPNAMIFKVGSPITFKIAGEPNNWHADRIEAIDTDLKTIAISTGVVGLQDIIAVRNMNPYPFLRAISYGLRTFAVSGIVWSSVGLVLRSPSAAGFMILSGCSGAVGWVIGKLTRHKTYHLGKNRRAQLRFLNLTPLLNDV